jgi:hypothetical protein
MYLDYGGPLHYHGRERSSVVLEGAARIPNKWGYPLRQGLHGRGGHPRNGQSDREAERVANSVSRTACFLQLLESFHKHLHFLLSEQLFFLLSANYDRTMPHPQAAHSCGAPATY